LEAIARPGFCDKMIPTPKQLAKLTNPGNLEIEELEELKDRGGEQFAEPKVKKLRLR